MSMKYVRFFKELCNKDVPLVGGKGASLGEMYVELASKGVRVPNGFAVTAVAFKELIKTTGAEEKLRAALAGVDGSDIHKLEEAGRTCRDIVYTAGLTPEIRNEVIQAYRQLVEEYGPTLSVAVRSSATAEDLPNASFAGQHDSYLNVHGEAMLIDAVARCNASLFTDRAIAYRIEHKFNHFEVFMSVCVMKMVRSDLASAGVMFTIDTETGHKDIVFITGCYGLGENVVQGQVDTDEFYVHKPTFIEGKRCVLRRSLGRKQMTMVYTKGSTRSPVVNQPTPRDDRKRFCLADQEVLELADYGIKIEAHYTERAGESRPMDIEWAKDGLDGLLYIVQARPETVASQRSSVMLHEVAVDSSGHTPVVTGRAVGAQCVTGAVRVVKNASELSNFRAGEILVSDTTTPDWGPVMATAAAIVCNRGGRTCHAAIVARELGIPAVVGAETATVDLKTGDEVTVSCAEGDQGRVYKGRVVSTTTTTNLTSLPRPQFTEVMVNVGNPEIAFQVSMLPCAGVGLARMEFIITNYIKIHPLALLHPNDIKNSVEKEQVKSLLAPYHQDGRAYFIERLGEGIGTIAAAFYPRPVVVRLSDFKTNEYGSLLGGSAYEPNEENPMLGWRGASRYAHPGYVDGFQLECEALARVRNDMGLTNVRVMVPFCRRIDEAKLVLETMNKFGLGRGVNGLQVYVMCEIPANVILIDRFAELFDGFSIGSNDLTQLTLGVDRDSERVAFEFDERDPAVIEMMRLAVQGAKRNKRHSGICGQAPSDYPEIATQLVSWGIDSVSVTPDRVLQTIRIVLDAERALVAKT